MYKDTHPISFFDKVPPPVLRQTDPRLGFINLPFFSLLSLYNRANDYSERSDWLREELDRRIRFIISSQNNRFDTAISTKPDETQQLTMKRNIINDALQKYNTVDLDINELVDVVAANTIN